MNRVFADLLLVKPEVAETQLAAERAAVEAKLGAGTDGSGVSGGGEGTRDGPAGPRVGGASADGTGGGGSPELVCTITENCRTLRFADHRFEEE